MHIDVFEVQYEQFLNNIEITSVTIHTGIDSIPPRAFDGCSSLQSITLPEGLESICRTAFCDCSSLKSIVLPNTLKRIDKSAFEGCSSLQSITFPEGLESIGNYAFYGCSSLQSITLPEGLEIGHSVFDFTRIEYFNYKCETLFPIKKCDNIIYYKSSISSVIEIYKSYIKISIWIKDMESSTELAILWDILQQSPHNPYIINPNKNVIAILERLKNV